MMAVVVAIVLPVGHVMANDAAGRRSGQGVMAGEVSHDRAGHGASNAAAGLGRAGGARQDQGEDDCNRLQDVAP